MKISVDSRFPLFYELGLVNQSIQPSPSYPPPPAIKAVKPVPVWLWGAIALIVVAVCIAVVVAIRQGSKGALAMVAPLHAQMVNGDVDGIFKDSDPVYQEQVGAVRSKQIFDLVRERLGAPESSRVAGFNFSTESKTGEELTLTFTTKFTHGTATETIKWRNINGRYRLLAYHIESQKMIESEIPQNLRS